MTLAAATSTLAAATTLTTPGNSINTNPCSVSSRNNTSHICIINNNGSA
jgi:hypothetical protein